MNVIGLGLILLYLGSASGLGIGLSMIVFHPRVEWRVTGVCLIAICFALIYWLGLVAHTIGIGVKSW